MNRTLCYIALMSVFALGCENEPEADGAEIWAQKCTLCHGEDAAGSGATPDIRQNLSDMTVAEIEDTVLNGSEGGGMIQIAVSEDEANAVAVWAKENLAGTGGE